MFGRAKVFLATLFAIMLFASLLLNWIFNPAGDRLQKLDQTEYEVVETIGAQAHS